jgi:fumarate reductase subunit D
VVHRLSGVLLALFLPVHLWALGHALEGSAALESFVRWTDRPVVHLAEIGLVLLLAAHLTGGLRLMVLELTPWRDGRKDLVAVGACLSLVFGLAFALKLV